MVVKAIPWGLVVILVLLICFVAAATWISLDVLFGDFINNNILGLIWKRH